MQVRNKERNRHSCENGGQKCQNEKPTILCFDPFQIFSTIYDGLEKILLQPNAGKDHQEKNPHPSDDNVSRYITLDE